MSYVGTIVQFCKTPSIIEFAITQLMKLERMKLENSSRSWKILITQYCIENFPTSMGTFQLKWNLSNFKLSNFSFFPTALSNGGVFKMKSIFLLCVGVMKA